MAPNMVYWQKKQLIHSFKLVVLLFQSNQKKDEVERNLGWYLLFHSRSKLIVILESRLGLA